jgi:hypothetical protein
LVAAFADFGLIAGGHGEDEVFGMGAARGFDDLASVASRRPMRMFSAMVPAKSEGICGTTAMWLRRSFLVKERRSVPSRVMRPAAGRKTAGSGWRRWIFPHRWGRRAR